jgi:predicted RNA-binding Zn-ribbon protein involved in translation (DUF1610 family)
MTETNNQLPRWARRVPKRKIRQLYETDAQGIYDLELINEVGYALLARCESFITANRAREGELPCPACGETVSRVEMRREEVLHCPCGWTLPWVDYLRTIQHKQLYGAEPVLKLFREYVRDFPRAGTARERMLLIDRLIHGFHWYYHQPELPTRPVAVNLIAGKMRDVVRFLDRLTYGDKSTPGMQEVREEWEGRLDVHPTWFPGRGNPGDE